MSSCVALFSFHLQSFPVSGSFPMCWLFTPGGQSIGISASVLPVKIQGWFPLELTGLISLQSKGFLRVFSSATIQKLSNCFLNSLVRDCRTDISQQEDRGLCSGEQCPWEGGGAEGGARCTETSVNPRGSSGPADSLARPLYSCIDCYWSPREEV